MTNDKESSLKRMADLALSGLAGGAILGGAGSYLGGARKATEIAKAAGTVGLGSGAMSAVGGLLGSALMGDPEGQERGAYAKRSLLGGAVAGGVAGLAAGSPGLRKLALEALKRGAGSSSKAASFLSRKTLDAVAAATPGEGSLLRKNLLEGGKAKQMALGLGIGGLGGAVQGYDEGSQYDSLKAMR
jgi:MFS family permease